MSSTRQAANATRWRVDFSLALFNRSGKFQIGQEIIADHGDQIDSIWYWRRPADAIPTGLHARLLGKAEKVERDLRVALGYARPSRRQGAHRWLHIDPLTVLHRPPAPRDIVLVHDMGPITHPQLFAAGVEAAYDLAFRVLAASEAGLVFVSQDSQNQYARLYGEPRSSQVIYPPIAARLHIGDREQPDATGDKFLLTVGAIGDRKNQERAIAAFDASGLASEGYIYVLCGSREPGHERVTALAGQTTGVRLLSFVSDAQLRWLYANASGFVLPSLLEGFGMPVAEAMAFGLTPIISRHSVLEEVAGPAALAVDPLDIQDIAKAMRQCVAFPHSERASRQAAMKSSLARFSRETFSDAWGCVLRSD